MGDLNVEFDDEFLQFLREYFEDSYIMVFYFFYGFVGIWCGFDISLVVIKRIDYVLSKNFMVMYYCVIDDCWKNNLYLFDYLLVLVYFQ